MSYIQPSILKNSGKTIQLLNQCYYKFRVVRNPHIRPCKSVVSNNVPYSTPQSHKIRTLSKNRSELYSYNKRKQQNAKKFSIKKNKKIEASPLNEDNYKTEIMMASFYEKPKNNLSYQKLNRLGKAYHNHRKTYQNAQDKALSFHIETQKLLKKSFRIHQQNSHPEIQPIVSKQKLEEKQEVRLKTCEQFRRNRSKRQSSKQLIQDQPKMLRHQYEGINRSQFSVKGWDFHLLNYNDDVTEDLPRVSVLYPDL